MSVLKKLHVEMAGDEASVPFQSMLEKPAPHTGPRSRPEKLGKTDLLLRLRNVFETASIKTGIIRL